MKCPKCGGVQVERMRLSGHHSMECLNPSCVNSVRLRPQESAPSPLASLQPNIKSEPRRTQLSGVSSPKLRACPKCPSWVRADRLAKHLRKMHRSGYSAPADAIAGSKSKPLVGKRTSSQKRRTKKKPGATRYTAGSSFYKPTTGSVEWDEGHGDRYETQCADCGSKLLFHICPYK